MSSIPVPRCHRSLHVIGSDLVRSDIIGSDIISLVFMYSLASMLMPQFYVGLRFQYGATDPGR